MNEKHADWGTLTCAGAGSWTSLGGSSRGGATTLEVRLWPFWTGDRHGKGLEAEFFEIPAFRNGRSGRNQPQDEECWTSTRKNSVEADWRRNPRSGSSASSGFTERARGFDKERLDLTPYWSVGSGSRVP